ncbi:hypothetical protein Tco_1305487, partial [Tanacetum coccineum]
VKATTSKATAFMLSILKPLVTFEALTCGCFEGCTEVVAKATIVTATKAVTEIVAKAATKAVAKAETEAVKMANIKFVIGGRSRGIIWEMWGRQLQRSWRLQRSWEVVRETMAVDQLYFDQNLFDLFFLTRLRTLSEARLRTLSGTRL